MLNKVAPLRCPKCGVMSDELCEGYCASCCEINQIALNEHNFEFDRWEMLTNEERKNEIKNAINHYTY